MTAPSTVAVNVSCPEAFAGFAAELTAVATVVAFTEVHIRSA